MKLKQIKASITVTAHWISGDWGMESFLPVTKWDPVDPVDESLSGICTAVQLSGRQPVVYIKYFEHDTRDTRASVPLRQSNRRAHNSLPCILYCGRWIAT